MTARGLRSWLASATVSTLGDSITAFALVWAASAHGAGAAGAVLTAEAIPLAALILAGGVLADRCGLRRVMIACDVAMAVVMTAFAATASAHVPVWALAGLGVVSGTVAALRRPAAGAFPRLFLGPSAPQLTRTMSTVSMCLQLARVAGPSLGGLLLGLGGLRATSGVDAASFVLVTVVLLRVRPAQEQAPRSVTPALRGLSDSFAAARRTPGVTAVLLTVTTLAASVLCLVMLCVPLAGRARGWAAHTTGLVEGAWLVGGIVVTAVAARTGRADARLAAGGPVVAIAGVAVLAFVDDPTACGFGVGAVGVGTTLLTSWLLPRFVAATPGAMLARFQALLGLAQTGPVLLALPMLSWTAGRYGVRAALGIVGLLLAITLGGVVRAQRLPETTDATADARICTRDVASKR